jgi:hypothetical protein
MTSIADQKMSEIGALKSKMLQFPRGFYEARQRHYDAQQRVKTLKAELDDSRMEALLTVSAAKVNGGDKPLYPNEAARNAAVSKALAENPSYRDLSKRLEGAETDEFNASLELRRLEDEHKAWRAAADLVIAEVSLLVAAR